MTCASDKLSAEELAACFRFLAFLDLITASHVCRFWRSSALAFPDLWSRVTVFGPSENAAELLHLAISRSAQLPVAFEHIQYTGRVPQSLLDAVPQYMHRFESFKWNYGIALVELHRRAPLLREFLSDEEEFFIPKDFLGGTADSLRKLHLGVASLPVAPCPALSTVMDLEISYFEFFDDTPRFRRLFELFPRLQALCFRDLDGAPGAELPSGPAPCTLETVKLSTWTECDLVLLYHTWELEAVAHVQLTMPPASPAKISSFFSGALELSIILGSSTGSQIIATTSAGRRRAVFRHDLMHVQDLPGTLVYMLRDGAALARIHTLQIQLSVLSRVLSVAVPWPRLTKLIVDIRRDDTIDPHAADHLPHFRWDLLSCLCAMAPLAALELRVQAPECPPIVHDARDLQEHLLALHDSLPREVLVHGFPSDVARGLAPDEDDQARVLFMFDR